MNVVSIVANQLPIQPAPLCPALARRLSTLQSRIEKRQGKSWICAQYAPTVEERDQLEKRLSALRLWLQPATEVAIIPHICKLMMSLAHQDDGVEARKALQRLYCSDLADLPLFAIERACNDFRLGDAGDRKWMPKKAQVREVAKKYRNELAREAHVIETILGSEIDAVVLPNPQVNRRRAAPQETDKKLEAALARFRKSSGFADVAKRDGQKESIEENLAAPIEPIGPMPVKAHDQAWAKLAAPLEMLGANATEKAG